MECKIPLLQTDRLVCSQDALPWRNDTEGCLMEFPLLRLGERGDLVRHLDPPAAFGCPVDDLFPLKNLLFCLQLIKIKVKVPIIVDHQCDLPTV